MAIDTAITCTRCRLTPRTEGAYCEACAAIVASDERNIDKLLGRAPSTRGERVELVDTPFTAIAQQAGRRGWFALTSDRRVWMRAR